LPCSINTFGFGYNLDSKLLQDIAAAGYGSYAFIPDAGFVGTVFVHAMANLLATMAHNVVLELEPLAGAAILHVHMPKLCRRRSFVDRPVPPMPRTDRQRLELRSLQFGQSRDLIVRMSGVQATGPAALQATLRYRTQAGEPLEQIVSIGCGPAEPTPDVVAKLERERCRTTFIEGLAEAIRLTGMSTMQGKQQPLGDAQRKLEEIEAQIADSLVAQTEEVESIQSILEDLRGQVTQAFSREDWFTKWGLHYLPSLLCAHMAQQCNNFKDAGVQHYGGELFVQLRDEADDIFERLPTLITPVQQQQPSTTNPSVPNVVPISMARYNDKKAG